MDRLAGLLAVLALAGNVNCAIDNTGTEFMLAFTDNYITGSTTYEIEIYVTTTSNNDAQVNVTTPLFNPSWISQTTVARGNIELLTVPADIRGAGVSLDNLGVHIISSEEITVYSVNKEVYSTDGFIAYPVDSLGDDYVAITWDGVPEIMVAVVTDGTDVSFALPSTYTDSFAYNGVTYAGGDTLTVTLDRYQTFHIYSTSGDLTGTRITSTNDVAAFSGNYKTIVQDVNTKTTSDHLIEQLVPTRALGKEFITFPSPDRNVGDYVRVVAAEDSTSYDLDGITYTLDANEYDTHNFSSGTYYWVSADKGVTVVVYSKTIGLTGSGDGPNGGDPAMSMSVPVALFGSDYTWSTVTTTAGDFNNYIILVTLRDYASDLVLDNGDFNATWVNVTGNSDYIGTVVDVSPGAHSIYNSIPAHGFMGIAYGNAQYNSYAYASGTRLASINLPCTPTVTAAGDGEDNDCDGRIDEETDNGIDDDGDGQIDEDLAIAPRVDGEWGSWGAYGACSSCGGATGTETRTRDCDNPAPANYGLDCVGNGTESQSCVNSSPCPIDGEWSAWSSWGSCGVTCGSGTQSRNRSCDNPAPQHGGNDCAGDEIDNGKNCTISSYCLPSFYGNLDLSCGNLSFACSTGSIQCIDIGFRCDGTIDCDDGTDESEYFTGCANTCSNRNAAGQPIVHHVWLALTTLLTLEVIAKWQ